MSSRRQQRTPAWRVSRLVARASQAIGRDAYEVGLTDRARGEDVAGIMRCRVPDAIGWSVVVFPQHVVGPAGALAEQPRVALLRQRPARVRPGKDAEETARTRTEHRSPRLPHAWLPGRSFLEPGFHLHPSRASILPPEADLTGPSGPVLVPPTPPAGPASCRRRGARAPRRPARRPQSWR